MIYKTYSYHKLYIRNLKYDLHKFIMIYFDIYTIRFELCRCNPPDAVSTSDIHIDSKVAPHANLKICLVS